MQNEAPAPIYTESISKRKGSPKKNGYQTRTIDPSAPVGASSVAKRPGVSLTFNSNDESPNSHRKALNLYRPHVGAQPSTHDQMMHLFDLPFEQPFGNKRNSVLTMNSTGGYNNQMNRIKEPKTPEGYTTRRLRANLRLGEARAPTTSNEEAHESALSRYAHLPFRVGTAGQNVRQQLSPTSKAEPGLNMRQTISHANRMTSPSNGYAV